MSPEDLTQAIAALAADKKAIDIVALDLRGVAGYTDFFLICSGGSDRQNKEIHDGIHEGMKKQHDTLPRRMSYWQATMFQAVNPKSWIKAITVASVFLPTSMAPLPAIVEVTCVP